VRGALLLQSERIRFEHCRDDTDPTALQPVNSITKSVLGMLVGVALQRGELAGLDQRLDALLPETRAQQVSDQARGITLWQLMTMTAGFDWDERQVDDCLLHACTRLDGDNARLRFILGRDMAEPPGTRFRYDSHAVHLLAIALTRIVNRSLDDYAAEHLFGPLGITSFTWERDEDGVPFGGRGLALATRDLARLGTLMLREGQWQGRELLPREYVRQVTTRHHAGGFPLEETLGYGGLWWIPAPPNNTEGSCFAFGFGEQLLAVDPSRDLVLAVTADSDKSAKHVREAWIALLDAQGAKGN
jgi:CubicO group peptidase (beta-lactamase class C family)